MVGHDLVQILHAGHWDLPGVWHDLPVVPGPGLMFWGCPAMTPPPDSQDLVADPGAVGAGGLTNISMGYPVLPPTHALFTNPHTCRVLPGTGEAYENCGCQIPVGRNGQEIGHLVAVCSDNHDHKRRVINKTCHRLECPICQGSALQRAAENMAARVNLYRQAVRRHNASLTDSIIRSGGRPPRHATMSLSQSEINGAVDRTIKALDKKCPEGWRPEVGEALFVKKYRAAVRRHLERLDLEAAAIVVHLDRVTDRGKRLYREAHPGVVASEDDPVTGIALWRWIRDQDNWRDLVYFSPHAHLLVYGPNLDTKEFYEETKAVYKVIREITPRTNKKGEYIDVRGQVVEYEKAILSAIVGVSYYLLSHTPVLEGRVSWSPYKGLTSHYLCSGYIVVREAEPCPDCGADMVKAVEDDQGDIVEVLTNQYTGDVLTCTKKVKKWWGWFKGDTVPPDLPPGAIRKKKSIKALLRSL